MGKVIRYKMHKIVNHGTDQQPKFVDVFHNIQILCDDDSFAVNLEIAKKEAYNGEYTIEEVGV